MADIEKKVIIDIETGNSEKSATNLKKRQKEVREEMQQLALAGKQATERYKELQAESGELSRAMQVVSRDTKEASTTFTNTAQYAAGALSGISGGVQAVTGVLAAFGKEADKDAWYMKTLIAAMSVTSGLQAIQSSVEAFKLLRTNIIRSTVAQKAFNLAMKANPIGLAVAAVTALVAGLVGLVKWLKKSSDESDKLADSAKKAVDSLDGLRKSQDYAYRYAQACGKTEKELRKLKKQQLEYNIQLARTAYLQATAAYNEDDSDKNKQIKEDAAKALREAKQALADWQNEIRIIDRQAQTDREKQAAETAKAQGKARKEALKRQKEEEAKQREEDLKAIEEHNKEVERANMSEKDRELKDLYDKYQELIEIYKRQGKDITELEQQYSDERLAIVDKYMDEVAEKMEGERTENAERDLYESQLAWDAEYYRRKKELLEKYKDDEKGMLIAMYGLDMEDLEQRMSDLDQRLADNLITQAEYNAEYAKLDAEKTERAQKEADRRIKITKEENKAKSLSDKEWYNGLNSMASSVGSILGSWADVLGEDAEQYKNIKAAEAIIDTLAASVAAFAGITKETSGWGIAAAVATAASVLATGYATVRRIYQVDTSGGTNSTSSTGVNYLSHNYTNARLTDGSGAEVNVGDNLAEQVGKIKVIVSAREISDVQEGTKKVLVRNTF